jgi:xylan 1,4-beta-xylosidase
VDGLHGKEIVAAEFRVDEMHSNAYRAWQQMGSPAHPSAEQTGQLEKAGALQQTAPDQSLAIQDGKAGMDLALSRQGVILVRLREK